MYKEKSDGKFVTTVKLGPKGQIIIPKEVRDMFNIQSGDVLLMLADRDQGVVLQTFENSRHLFDEMFPKRK